VCVRVRICVHWYMCVCACIHLLCVCACIHLFHKINAHTHTHTHTQTHVHTHTQTQALSRVCNNTHTKPHVPIHILSTRKKAVVNKPLPKPKCACMCACVCVHECATSHSFHSYARHDSPTNESYHTHGHVKPTHTHSQTQTTLKGRAIRNVYAWNQHLQRQRGLRHRSLCLSAKMSRLLLVFSLFQISFPVNILQLFAPTFHYPFCVSMPVFGQGPSRCQYECLCVCVCVCASVSVFVSVSVSVLVSSLCLCVYVHEYVCLYIYEQAHTHARAPT